MRSNEATSHSLGRHRTPAHPSRTYIGRAPSKKDKQTSEFARVTGTIAPACFTLNKWRTYSRRTNQSLRTSGYDFPTRMQSRCTSGRICENSTYHDIQRETRGNQARRGHQVRALALTIPCTCSGWSASGSTMTPSNAEIIAGWNWIRLD